MFHSNNIFDIILYAIVLLRFSKFSPSLVPGQKVHQELFAQKPISQLIDDGMKPNWGTGCQNLEQNWKIVLSHTLFHFQF